MSQTKKGLLLRRKIPIIPPPSVYEFDIFCKAKVNPWNPEESRGIPWVTLGKPAGYLGFPKKFTVILKIIRGGTPGYPPEYPRGTQGVPQGYPPGYPRVTQGIPQGYPPGRPRVIHQDTPGLPTRIPQGYPKDTPGLPTRIPQDYPPGSHSIIQTYPRVAHQNI